MAKILKFWHQWNWAIHAAVWLMMATAVVVTYKDGVATNTTDIADLKQQHKDENMATRMAVQESNSRDIGDRLGRIEIVQGKIFDRIDKIADRH